eukprot:4848117-Karenia_brevis.AAC.1
MAALKQITWSPHVTHAEIAAVKLIMSRPASLAGLGRHILMPAMMAALKLIRNLLPPLCHAR